MAGQLRVALQDVQAPRTPETFDPVAAEGGFKIAVETHQTMAVLPQFAEIRKRSQGLNYSVFRMVDEIPAGIDRGTFDLAIGSFRVLPDRVSNNFKHRGDSVPGMERVLT